MRFPPTISVSDFVRQVKGASAHFVSRILRSPDPFKWQGSYGAFTVSPRHVPLVRAYVLDQRRRHAELDLLPRLELTTAPADETK